VGGKKKNCKKSTKFKKERETLFLKAGPTGRDCEVAEMQEERVKGTGCGEKKKANELPGIGRTGGSISLQMMTKKRSFKDCWRYAGRGRRGEKNMEGKH